MTPLNTTAWKATLDAQWMLRVINSFFLTQTYNALVSGSTPRKMGRES